MAERQYDFLVVGAGLFGAVFAREATRAGRRCLVIDRRSHIGGNVYTREEAGIQVHQYGAHIFHTSDRRVWDYVNGFAAFNRFTNAPLARYGGELYNLPFNMNTFHALWGVTTPEEARAMIARQVAEAGIEGEPRNLEEQAIRLVGRDIYEKLVRGYTEKQWGRPCDALPAFIIRRLPVRFTYDNNYFSDTWQGIPIGGYTQMVARMLEGVEVRLNSDFFADRAAWTALADRVVFTGMIDQYFDYRYGELEYRSLRFETETLPTDNYQGNAVVNYTDRETPFTRVIEHRHFEGDAVRSDVTVITREYPMPWRRGDEPYYPLNDARNNALYDRYRARAAAEPGVIFGGRLGMYRYFDMHNVIAEALDCAERTLLDPKTR